MFAGKIAKEEKSEHKMEKTDKPSPEERFHANVVGLGELLYDIVKEVNGKGYEIVTPSMIELTVRVLEKLDHVTVIHTFISKSYEGERIAEFKDHCWEKIRGRDRTFFLQNAGKIFSDLPMVPTNSVNAFSKMFSLKDAEGNFVVSKEDEEEIWEYFESLVKIAIKYIHEKRHPVLIHRESEEIRRYENRAFENIDIVRHARSWGIDLEFYED